ncbi:aquaporin-9b [Pimephales promelas]|uniref:aquaporin-9b n=1 Tax=Pimephales promelas TaxID=90988 RepID=UPI001955CACE|nr:aquaporin-9b [Pimephales promelas]KAG1942121.1 aquaporin-9 [Pimephales promelas]KAG1942122.1 aquaporin-9 [Pimephales promelas]
MELEKMRKLRGKCMLRRDIIREFLAELLGTFVLILFGCGSVAQKVLSRGTQGEDLTIHFGFTLGVMLAVYMAGGVSGGHVNPAVSLAMVVLGKLPIKKFPVYVAAQFLGAFAGSCAVYALYYGAFANFSEGHLHVTGQNATAGIFASYPREGLSLLNGFVDQVIGTGALVLCILAIVDKKNIGAPKGMEPLVVGLSILAIGVSMALNCGYPINPARDLGPRLFTAIAGWGLDVFSAGNGWWWVPVVGPMVGGVVGAVIYFFMIELHHPEPEKYLEDDNSVKDKYELNTVN